MLETKIVFLDDPQFAEQIAELISQGWRLRSGIKQHPITGEPFPAYEVLTRYPKSQ